MHLIKVAMLHIFVREFQLPIIGAFDALAAILFLFLPFIEVAHQINICGVGSPLTEHPSFLCFMQSEVVVSIGKLTERCFAFCCQLSDFSQYILMASTNSIFIGFQIHIVFHNAYVFRNTRFSFRRSRLTLFDFRSSVFLCCNHNACI